MPLPRYIILRGETYHVRKPVPLDLHPAFGGRKEVTRSLHTKSLKAAVAASHAVLADIERDFDRRRRDMQAEQHERAFTESDDFDEALQQHSAISKGTLGSVTYAWRASTQEDKEALKLAIDSGQAVPRPSSRAAALKAFDHALADLEFEAAQVQIVPPMEEDDDPSLIVPARHAPALKEALAERLEAERRSLEATRTMIAGVDDAKAGTSAGTVAKVSTAEQDQASVAE